MISIKDRPRHLYARITSMQIDYPCEDFCLESLVMIAELEEITFEFDILIVLCSNSDRYDVVLFEKPGNSPERSCIYIMDDKDDLIRRIGEKLQVKRRSQKSNKQITDWLSLRIKEYANSRIL